MRPSGRERAGGRAGGDVWRARRLPATRRRRRLLLRGTARSFPRAERAPNHTSSPSLLLLLLAEATTARPTLRVREESLSPSRFSPKPARRASRAQKRSRAAKIHGRLSELCARARPGAENLPSRAQEGRSQAPLPTRGAARRARRRTLPAPQQQHQTMSVGYAELLAPRADVGGTLGGPETHEGARSLLGKMARLAAMVRHVCGTGVVPLSRALRALSPPTDVPPPPPPPPLRSATPRPPSIPARPWSCPAPKMQQTPSCPPKR